VGVVAEPAFYTAWGNNDSALQDIINQDHSLSRLLKSVVFKKNQYHRGCNGEIATLRCETA
jgi:hypothetical protein